MKPQITFVAVAQRALAACHSFGTEHDPLLLHLRARPRAQNTSVKHTPFAPILAPKNQRRIASPRLMAIKKSDLYSSLWASCDELRGGMERGHTR